MQRCLSRTPITLSMNGQQWSRYSSFPPQNSFQQSPLPNLPFDASWPTENLETNESNRAVSNVYSYSNSLTDRPLGWMSSLRDFDAAVVNEEVNSEESDKQQVTAIQLCLALVTNTFRSPKIIFDVELEAESRSMVERNGIFDISVESILSLINLAYLPSEIALALQDLETQLATAECVPPMFYPVYLLPKYRILASKMEISFSPPSHFLLQSLSNAGFLYFLPVRESEQPKFVLILLRELTNSVSVPTALRSESQPSIPSNVVYADRSSDGSIPPHRCSLLPDTSLQTEIPFESQIGFAIPTSAMIDQSAAYTQVVSSNGPQLSDTQVDGVGLSQTISSTSRFPVHATDVSHACRLIGILVPQGPPASLELVVHRPISELIQDWFRAWMLTVGLGYDETKGGLSVQTYTWLNGNVETFEHILRSVNWKLATFTKKTSLYNWAINATSTKVWNDSLSVPVDQERLVNAAKRTWNRLVLFFQETSFLYSGNPRSCPKKSREYGLTYLHESDVRKHRPTIQAYLIDRPDISG
ncbi:hypothetical protein F5878DRAFT_662141 [Lentinula raphanica]|uniref:Uncharacterized protein n=1 Tax=Lentinula raphanica TaxID=153919 RepID=A0AA38P772_9AGAR|nr:hypothetical protein F5878DRAFT_662141 [Lentinula raphanica]